MSYPGYNADGTPIVYLEEDYYEEGIDVDNETVYMQPPYPTYPYPAHPGQAYPAHYSQYASQYTQGGGASQNAHDVNSLGYPMQVAGHTMTAAAHSTTDNGRRGLDLLEDPQPGCHPGYSIKVLMQYAIQGSPTGRLSLNDIYEAVERRFPIMKTDTGKHWRNSARHDISHDPRFINTPRPGDTPGKGGLWMFDPTVPPRAPKPREPRTNKVNNDIVPPAGKSGMGRFRLNTKH